MLAYNNTFKKDIKISPFFTNYGFKTKPTHIIRNVEVVVKKIIIKIHQFKKLHQQLSENITFLKIKITQFTNLKRSRKPILKKKTKHIYYEKTSKRQN